MAYATGVSTSLSDLITRLKTFAVSQGWTSGPTWAAGVGTQYPITCTYLAKGGFFYNLSWHTSTPDTLLLDVSTNSDGASYPHLQTGACGGGNGTPELRSAACRPLMGPHIGYHFFSDGLALHCVVEIVTGVFSHFSFGEVKKAGTFAGAQYVEGSCWSSDDNQPGFRFPWDAGRHVRPFDGIYGFQAGAVYVGPFIIYNVGGLMRTPFAGAPSAWSVGVAAGGAPSGSGYTGSAWSSWSWGIDLINDSPNQFNSRSVLVPLEVVVASTRTNAPNWMQIGQLQTVAAVNIANIDPKDTINTDWMVFPLCQKNGAGTTYVNSQNYGLAYKK